MKIGYLEKSEKESILSANSASSTAGRNRYCFWVNLNPKFILINLYHKLMIAAKIGYIVSQLASYFDYLEVHFSFPSYSRHSLQLRTKWSLSFGGQCN